MKKIAFSVILLCLTACVGFSQKSKAVVEPTAAKPARIKSLNEIPSADWKNLIDAVQAEDWEKSSLLADDYLSKLKLENNEKQMARLRYILLYALAGKVVEKSFSGKKFEEDKARVELEKRANEFLEKEFFMPSREIADECAGKLNYVCVSKQQKNVLRTTATNQAGTAIYSFEYVKLKENLSLGQSIGKQAILGGTLKKIEFNPNKSNVWIMRLFFEDGSLNVVSV